MSVIKADRVPPTIDDSRCPLCGQANSCLNASSNSRPDPHCWCHDSSISFPQQLASQVPESLKRKTCICRACLERYPNVQSDD